MGKAFVTLVLVMVGVVSLLLLQASRTGTSRVMTPSQLAMAPPTSLDRIRVAGKVAALPVSYTVDPEFQLEFSIVDPEPSKGMHGTEDVNPEAPPVKVLYRNTKPDMFAPGRDVIIDGSYDGERLIASRLLTQCPSKYEPAEPGKAQEAKTTTGS